MGTVLITVKGSGLIPFINKQAPLVRPTPIQDTDAATLRSMGWEIKVHGKDNLGTESKQSRNGGVDITSAPAGQDPAGNKQDNPSTDQESEAAATTEQNPPVNEEAMNAPEAPVAPEADAEELPEGVVYDAETQTYTDSEGKFVVRDENGDFVYIEEQNDAAVQQPEETVAEHSGGKNKKKNR